MRLRLGRAQLSCSEAVGWSRRNSAYRTANDAQSEWDVPATDQVRMRSVSGCNELISFADVDGATANSVSDSTLKTGRLKSVRSFSPPT